MRKMNGMRRGAALCAALTMLVALLGTATAGAEAGGPFLPILPCDILVDAGHGGIDSGCVVEGFEEKHVNLALALALGERLRALGYRVVLTRTTDRALSDDVPGIGRGRHARDLLQRKRLADALRPLVFVSLHANWARDPVKRGGEVLHPANGQSLFLATLLQEALNRHYGLKRHPVPARSYFLLNTVRCPVVIVEAGYLSHPDDRRRLTSPAERERLADALANAIHQFLLVFPNVRPRHRDG